MLLVSLLQLPTPLLTRYLIDNILPAKDLYRLNIFTFLLVIIILLKAVITYFQRYISIVYRNKVDISLRASLFSKLFLIPYKSIEKERVGYWESRISGDIGMTQSLFLETFFEIAMNIFTFTVGIGLLIYLNFQLTIIAIITLPIYALIYHAFSRKMNAYTIKHQEQWAIHNGKNVEYLSQNLLIRTFGKLSNCLRLYLNSLGEAIEISKRFMLFNAYSSIIVNLISSIMPLIVIWYGIRQIILGDFTLGSFIAYNIGIGYLYGPISNFVNINIDINAASAAAERIFSILDQGEESTYFGSEKLHSINSLKFKNVSFLYGKEKRGIVDISFDIERAKSIAVIGETGTGKSTILKLISGTYIAERGYILINDKNIMKYDLDSLRKRIGYVSQEPELLSGSILNNITFFEDITDSEFIDKLLDICILRETISRLDNGLYSEVQECGKDLSGGEKQRIAIARALYRAPDLLLLDEISSALDPVTEKKLLINIFSLDWKPAIIMVTHRHDNLRLFDNILEL